MFPHSVTSPHQSLPGERAFVGRMGLVAGVVGVLADALLWLAAPDKVTQPALFAATMALTAVVAVVCGAVRWEEVSQRWIQLPVGLGIVLVALASPNTGASDSPLTVFYFVILLVLAYAGTLPQVLLWGGAAVVAQLTPVLYEDAAIGSVAAGAAVRGVSTLVLAAAVQQLRHRVRAAAAGERALELRDPLTGAVSAQGLAERLGAEVARARRHDAPLSVLVLDLLTPAADLSPRRLRAAAGAIGAALRGEDLVARAGATRFVVVLPGAEAAQARRVAARVLATLERLGGWDGVPCRIGGATFPEDGLSADDLLAAAHESLAVGGIRLSSAGREPQAESQGVQWPTRGLPLLLAGPAALVVAGWFLLPSLAPASTVRPLLTLAVLAGVLFEMVRTARYVRGRERRGWALMPLGVLIALPPAGGLPGLSTLSAGLLLASGRGWRRDRVRALDTAIVALAVAGTIYAIVLLPALEGGELHGFDRVAGVAGALGSGVAVTIAVLVAATVGPRRRPDIALVLLGLGLAAVLPLPYALHSGGEMTMREPWEVIVPLAALPALVGSVLRRRGPRRALMVHAGEADPAPMLWVGTALLAALIGVTMALHGSIPPVVGGVLLVTVVLRALRFHVVQRQRARFATLARHSDAVRAAQQRASLEALARALEARDGYTGRHGEETVEIAVRVAAQLGLEEAEVEEVRTVALLHDIGKIGIPNDILHKDGPLDDDEWERMREHPVIGERILRAVPGLERVADAVRSEHERWDGGGYPDGISGEDIPLPSRVTLVCDAWHAMTSDRPYRRAMPLEDAVEQLLAHAGTQFDRAVVRALLQVLEADGVDVAAQRAAA